MLNASMQGVLSDLSKGGNLADPPTRKQVELNGEKVEAT